MGLAIGAEGLGLGGPAEICAAAVTPGWQVMFEVNETQFEVRTDETGDTIRLAEDAGQASLTGSAWRLQSLPAPGQMEVMGVLTDNTLTLVSEAGGVVTGTGGCNEFGGQYRVDGPSLTITVLVQTERACLDEAVMQQEDRYLEALRSASTYALEGDRLGLGTDVG